MSLNLGTNVCTSNSEIFHNYAAMLYHLCWVKDALNDGPRPACLTQQIDICS